MGGLKRTKQDKIFSLLIREGANWTCENCGRYFPDDSGRQYLHCSHYMSRRHQSTRCDPDNAFAHCFSCHKQLGESPANFYRFYCEQRSEEAEEIILEKSRMIRKRTKADKEDQHKHLKSEYAIMLEKRANGDDSKLSFVGYD